MPTPQVSANVDGGPFIAVNSAICTQRRCLLRQKDFGAVWVGKARLFFHESPSQGYVRFPHSWPALLRSLPVFKLGFESLAATFLNRKSKRD